MRSSFCNKSIFNHITNSDRENQSTNVYIFVAHINLKNIAHDTITVKMLLFFIICLSFNFFKLFLTSLQIKNE